MACLTHPVRSLLIANLDDVYEGVRSIAPVSPDHALLIVRPHVQNWHCSVLGVVWILIVEVIASEQPEGLLLLLKDLLFTVFHCVFNFEGVDPLRNAEGILVGWKANI